jgi:hypothetical protein
MNSRRTVKKRELRAQRRQSVSESGERMFMKRQFVRRQFVCAASIVVTSLASACNSAQDSSGLSPTTPSPNSQAAAISVQTAASSVQSLTTEGLTGDCPAITFTIGEKTVRTNAATSFGSSCTSLKNGERVVASGTPQSDGSIVATCVAGL